jgi:GNAT superfamily N-acetyltransferase
VPDTRPLRAYLQLQTALDTDVLTALRASANNLDTELRRLENKVGVGAAVRREQLLHTQVAINKQMASLWTKVGELTKAADLEAAAAGAQSILDGSESTIASLFSEAERETMVRSARLSAQRGLDTALERVSGTSRIPLAESVYHNTALTSGKIEEIVNNAITRGASAADLARDVRQYINPNTPGGVRYAAMRLGRTELNNAFHASQVRQAQKSPFISGLKWNLSGSHPRPDECNDYAGHNDDGIFSPTEVPAKPHPNCLCYTTPETVSEDAFVQAYKRGDYDGFLEESGLPPAPETEKIIPPGPVTPAPSIPTPKPTVSAQTRAATIEDFPRMEPQAYREAVPVVNPGTGTEFRNNCHFVAPSMELRARGFDIVARQTFKATGRIDRSIENDWLDPLTGKPRRFRNMLQPPAKDARGMNIGPVEKKEHYRRQFDQIKIADWPPNSRGFAVVEWDGGSAHIFNMYRDEHGEFKFVDGQVNKQEVSNYFSKVKSVQIMRVDDLEPVAERLSKVATPELEPVNVLTRRKVLEDFIEQYTADAGLAPTRDYNFYRDEITRFREELAKLPKPGSAAEAKAAAEASKKAADAAAKVAERERLRAEKAAEEAAQIAKFKKIAEEEQRVKAEAAAKAKADAEAAAAGKSDTLIRALDEEDTEQAAMQAFADDFRQHIQDKVLAQDGLTLRADSTRRVRGHLVVESTIHDSEGKLVGRINRYFVRHDDGQIEVHHDYFTLNEAYQGKGIGVRMTREMDAYYKTRGVNFVSTLANIDVGGYTWAKQGFDWDHYGHDATPDIKKILSRSKKLPGAEEFMATIDEMLAAVDIAPDAWVKARIEGPEAVAELVKNYPTPRQIAMLGHLEGTETWFGKRAMLDQSWNGRKVIQ